MMEDLPPSSPALEKLVTLIRDTTGNVISPARYAFLEEVAQRRARSRGLQTVTDYVQALSGNSLDGEWENLIPLVTIKESYFFRAPQQFEIIRQQVLPELMRARSQSRHLRVWSAACARGEEPSTLAMLLNEEPALEGWDWTIVATDVDEGALAGARLGLYGDRAVNQVPPHLLERYFHRRGKLFEFDPVLRSRIVYRQINLSQPPFGLPFSEFDLILIRNVLIYFRRPLQRWVVTHMGRMLSPSGYLFLGASETLWQVQDDLEAVDLGSCFCYRHRTGPPPAPPAPPPIRAKPAAPPPEPAPAPVASSSLDETWTTRRGGMWSRGTPSSGVPEPQPCEGTAPARSPLAPVSTPLGVQELLAQAARQLSENRIAEASSAVARVMATDPSEPAAYTLEGFLHDLSGRPDDAVASYRAALYLDPSLFQARMLLADCLLRLGHRDPARHQYREALTTLESGRERTLSLFAELPLPDRDRARRRCQEVLKRG